MVDDLFAVEVHLEVVAFAAYDHLVPFSRLFRHVLGWPDRADYAAMIMVPHLVVGLAVRVQNLTLDTRLHGILGVADAKIHATVSPLGYLYSTSRTKSLYFFSEVR